MNQFVEEHFVESLQRLALGIEPIDAGRLTRIGHPIAVTLDTPPPGLRRPRLERHNSTRFALRYFPGEVNQVDLRFPLSATGTAMRRLAIPIPPAASLTVRFDDPARRFVPRRLRNPNPDGFRCRTGQPPGSPAETLSRLGLRCERHRKRDCADASSGQVDGADIGARWARVVATLPGTAVVVGRAQGDDRGRISFGSCNRRRCR